MVFTSTDLQALMHEHRNEMRIMTGILEDAGLYQEFQDEVEERTGNNELWLGACNSECGLLCSCLYCGTSAEAARIKALEDENAKLRRELQDRQNFIVAVASGVAATT